MFKKIYTKFVDFSVAKPWYVIGAALLVTLFFAWQASTLKLAMTWMDMMPQDEPVVVEYQRLVELFGTADMIIGVVEASSEERATALTRQTAEELSKLKKWVKRVDYTIDTEFIRKHGLMLAKAKELKRLRRILKDPNLLPWITALNDDFEREYIEDAGNLQKEESRAAMQIHALGVLADTLGRLADGKPVSPENVATVVDRLTLGEEHYLSTDRKMALLMVQPTFTSNEFDKATLGTLDMQEIVDRINAENKDAHVGLTGMNVVIKDETVTAQEDSMMITLGALIVITLLFILIFRMWSAPLLAMLILVVGIIWDYGLAGMLIGKLSMFSAMSALILIGLGVDYLMHFLNTYFEARVEGREARDAIMTVYHKSGRAIVLGAFTTSVAFFTMLLTDFPAMMEFGATVGLGILSCLGVTLFILPSILVLRDQRLQKKAARQGKTVKPYSGEFKFLNAMAFPAYTYPRITIITVIVITGLMLGGVKQLGFDQNLLNIEAKGLESVELYDVMEERFNMSADGLIFTAESLEEAESKMHQLDELSTVGGVESIALYLPAQSSQAERRPLVKDIRSRVASRSFQGIPESAELAEQIRRLSDNIIEMGQLGYISGLTKLIDHCDLLTGLDSEGKQTGPNRVLQAASAVSGTSRNVLNDFSKSFFSRMKANILSMANPEEIKLEDIRPDIRERFISPDGKLFAVQVYSRKNVYKHMDDTSFIEDVHSIEPGATGMPAFMRRLITIVGEKGRLALGLALVIIFLLLWINFRNLGYTLLALLPMVLAYIFMFGTMGWINMPLTIVSVMMLPLILGIGIDDGIHLIHRYRIEGPGSQPRVVLSTGKAIFLTTATTMLGFGSLIFAKYQGFGQMGWVSVFGIGWAFLISIILIPAILKLMER